MQNYKKETAFIAKVLQKRCWHQKKRVFQMSSVIKELQEKQFINEDHVAVLMNNFGKDQELINRMFCRSKDIKISRKYGEEISLQSRQLQEDEGLHLANKLRWSHILF